MDTLLAPVLPSAATQPILRAVLTSVGQPETAGLADLRHQYEITMQFWCLGTGVTDDVILVLSELYTNVAVHVPGSSCTVALIQTSSVLRLAVRDDSPRIPDIPRGDFCWTLEESGRGLGIVAGTATRFAFERNLKVGPGKIAVAEWDVAA